MTAVTDTVRASHMVSRNLAPTGSKSTAEQALPWLDVTSATTATIDATRDRVVPCADDPRVMHVCHLVSCGWRDSGSIIATLDVARRDGTLCPSHGISSMGAGMPVDPLGTQDNFASLSTKDLLEARDQYHWHLIRKRNVVAHGGGVVPGPGH